MNFTLGKNYCQKITKFFKKGVSIGKNIFLKTFQKFHEFSGTQGQRGIRGTKEPKTFTKLGIKKPPIKKKQQKARRRKRQRFVS